MLAMRPKGNAMTSVEKLWTMRCVYICILYIYVYYIYMYIIYICILYIYICILYKLYLYIYSDVSKLRTLTSFPKLWFLNLECRHKPCCEGILDCRPGGILSFSVSMHQTTVLPYKMHHAKFSPCSVFSSIRVTQKKITLFEEDFEACTTCTKKDLSFRVP